jgi:hypothetical protein
VLYELLQENEYSSDSKINVKISLGGEQSASSDEAENVSNNNNTQPDVGANSGAERAILA